MTPETPPPAVVAAAAALWRSAGGQHWIAVEGRSMWPLLRPGDAVLVQHGDLAPRPGEVLVVVQDGRPLVHRLLAVTTDAGDTQFWTQGDAQPQPDAAHALDASLGRVIARRRAGREQSLNGGLTTAAGRLVAALQWGARGPRRPGRTLRRALVRALTTLLWRW